MREKIIPRYSKPIRVSKRFFEDMQNITRKRINKNFADPLCKTDISLAEMTELLTKTEAYKMAMGELEFKPKKRKNDNVIQN